MMEQLIDTVRETIREVFRENEDLSDIELAYSFLLGIARRTVKDLMGDFNSTSKDGLDHYTATSFKKKEQVIVGFNWGVDEKWIKEGNKYGLQDEYPLKNFASCYEDLGSFKRVLPFFYKWFELLPQVQINYCFFRSEEEKQISPLDLELCENIFNELIEYLNPSMLISFSKKLDNHLKQDNKLKYEEKIIQSGKIQLSITKGTIDIIGEKIPYYYLPHPNYPLGGEAREEAWEYCFGEPKY